MKNQLLLGLTATTLLTTSVASTGCGYILHPERRGNQGGTIDGTTLLFDLLWLLPGIVPGVVFLIVDFSSGAIYRGAGISVRPDGHLAVKVPASTEPTQLELRLVTAERRIVAQQAAVVGPSVEDTTVELAFRDALRAEPDQPLYLEVATARGVARYPTAINVAR